MVAHFWQGIIVALMGLSLVMGCASSPYVGTGAALGGGLGALAGAAIGHRNPWAGALIGGAAGTALGAAGGYAVQQRRTAQPQQGYYQQAPPGYGYQGSPPAYGPPSQPPYSYRTPAPGPAYGYNTPEPPDGPRYSANAPTPAPAPPGPGNSWNTPAPVTPGDSGYGGDPGYGTVPQSYSQAPQPSRVHTPVTRAPYNTYE